MQGSTRKREEANPRLLGTWLMKCGSSLWHKAVMGRVQNHSCRRCSAQTISYLSRDTGCAGLLEPVSSP